MKSELNKLATKRRGKRCPSAGIFCTSSAGAVISLILRNKIVSAASSLILMLLFCGLIGTFSLTGATDILGLGGSAYAADSINLNIDTNSLSLDTMSTSTTGNFATSSNMNISVSTTSENGYTLSMRSATGSTSLVNTTDSSKTINSISSAVTPANYADDAYASANNLNNTWGYLPSKYNSAANSNFLPLPTATAQIIETTDSANPTANTYTLSFGTRVNNETAVGSYNNDSFVIIAMANIVPLTINYNANGGYFGSSTSTTLNTVAYDATSDTESSTETVTKYAHTPNVSDAGVANTTYANNLNTTDTVTIDGATQLTVTIYYDAESTSYDWVSVYQSPFNISDSNDATVSTATGNLSGKLSGRNSGRTSTYSSWYTKTYTVSGDTVKFHFKSDGSQVYYGYYAIVTGEVSTTVTTYSKTAISGSYATPNNSDSDLVFKGWSESQSGSGTLYADESEVSTKLPYVNGDPAVTLYAVWASAGPVNTTCSTPVPSGITYMQELADSAKKSAALSSMTQGSQYYLVDERDNQGYCVAKQADGNIWMTQNLDLDIGGSGAAALTSENTDLNTSGSAPYVDGYSTSGGVITWSPASTATTSGRTISGASVSGWTDNNSAPYSAEGGDRYYFTSGTTSDETAQTLAQCAAVSGRSKELCAHYHVGNYYNWNAAIASNNSGSYSPAQYTVASNSICPKGWKIPQGRTSSADATWQLANLWWRGGAIKSVDTRTFSNEGYTTDGFNIIRTSPLFFVRAGDISGNVLNSGGSSANYWASTVWGDNYSVFAGFGTGHVLPSEGGAYQRSDGQTIRCVVR